MSGRNNSSSNNNPPPVPLDERPVSSGSSQSHNQSQNHNRRINLTSAIINNNKPKHARPRIFRGENLSSILGGVGGGIDSTSPGPSSSSALHQTQTTSSQPGGTSTKKEGFTLPKSSYKKGEFPPPYRTTSPLFTAKSDAELDRCLQLAYDKSMQMLTPEEAPMLAAFEKIICDGYSPQWKEFLDNEILCDCVLQSKDGKNFKAHRCILASACPHLNQLFTKKSAKDANWNSEDPQKIKLKDMDSKSLKCVIDFAYTGQFEMSVDTIEKLLPMAKQYKILPIIQQCCNYLVKHMTPENCLRIFNFARPYFCSKLESEAKKFILYNFRPMTRTKEFLELPPSALNEILGDDHLNARNEAMVFEAIRNWVEHSPAERLSSIASLLPCVRFGLMSYGYFTNVVHQWKYVDLDESVRRALYPASIFLTSMDSLNNSEVDLNDPLARPRIPHEIIFAVGGWSAGSPTSFMETYDVRADRWFLLNNPDSTPRAYHGLVALGHYIYVIGGFDGNEHFSTVKRYNPVDQSWEAKSCMLNARCYVSCCHLDGIIYACGGYNGRSRMASAEKYTPSTNQWELIPPMNRQRSDASAASLKGKVYVAGGFTGTEVLNSVETYDPKEGQWTFIQPMNTARSGVALVAYRECLYAIGGFNGFNRLNTGEKYNPDEPGPWIVIPEMSSARSNFAAVSADELLICIGGFNGATTIPYVECYDSKVNEWFDASHMNLNRSALSACVVPNLPNAHEYSYIHRIQELLGISIPDTRATLTAEEIVTL